MRLVGDVLAVPCVGREGGVPVVPCVGREGSVPVVPCVRREGGVPVVPSVIRDVGLLLTALVVLSTSPVSEPCAVPILDVPVCELTGMERILLASISDLVVVDEGERGEDFVSEG